MKHFSYYNDFDPLAAAWLRELIKRGLIAPGEVDERSIEDVRPNDLVGFTQCHFFAGIGVWSYALRQAGWSDDRPVWSGSCPCQPFSAAGQGAGFADERHLWPAFFWLLEQCRPAVVFGEQVASKAVEPWIDLVQNDLEGVGYAFGTVPFPASGVGAPHIRDRLFWVADASSQGLQERERNRGVSRLQGGAQQGETAPVGCSSPGGLADAERNQEHKKQQRPSATEGEGGANEFGRCNASGGMADAYEPGLQPWERNDQTERYWHTVAAKSLDAGPGHPGPTNGHWRDADWLLCRDGKWRPTESRVEPLADGLADRMGYSRIGDRHALSPLIEKGENRAMRLKGYGNAIVAPAAQVFIETVMDTLK